MDLYDGRSSRRSCLLDHELTQSIKIWWWYNSKVNFCKFPDNSSVGKYNLVSCVLPPSKYVFIRFLSNVDRMTNPNYMHRMPRTPYQTTPFTIDPSARSTQTFAERYGVSPPHSTEDLYEDCGKSSIALRHADNKVRKKARVDLSKLPSTSNISQQTTTTLSTSHNNNNSSTINDDETFHSNVIGDKNELNNTHQTEFDVEQKIQVRITWC